ncbi:MAG: hypothetical protein IJ848_02030 [Alphaproteobacteria bacterium]|nr:hypothetical protein [Alphaproteobacteria bacterium]
MKLIATTLLLAVNFNTITYCVEYDGIVYGNHAIEDMKGNYITPLVSNVSFIFMNREMQGTIKNMNMERLCTRINQIMDTLFNNDLQGIRNICNPELYRNYNQDVKDELYSLKNILMKCNQHISRNTFNVYENLRPQIKEIFKTGVEDIKALNETSNKKTEDIISLLRELQSDIIEVVCKKELYNTLNMNDSFSEIQYRICNAYRTNNIPTAQNELNKLVDTLFNNECERIKLIYDRLEDHEFLEAEEIEVIFLNKILRNHATFFSKFLKNYPNKNIYNTLNQILEDIDKKLKQKEIDEKLAQKYHGIYRQLRVLHWNLSCLVQQKIWEII